MLLTRKIMGLNLGAAILMAFLFTLISAHATAKTCEQILQNQTIQADQNSLPTGSVNQKLTAEEASALDLALALGVDPDLTKLVKNPRIAQYIYLSYFAEKVGQNELRVALSDIVKDFEVNHVDLFNLLNKELDEALNDPDVRKKIEALKFSGRLDKNLRPSRLRAATDRFFSQVKQALNFIPTMKRAYRLVQNGMSKSSLYEGLFHFYGATQLGLEDSLLRPWETTKNGYEDIRPNQIERMSPMGWAMLAYFASETEAPIVSYSTTSGELTRGLNDALSKFLGTTWEEFEAYTEEEQKKFLEGKLEYDTADFCTAVWCKEERRHDPALMYIAQQIWGQVRQEDGGFFGDAVEDYVDADEAINHLIARNASEWNANAIYFFLGAHSSGPAAQWVDQPRIDETKHMAIFAASYKYFMGPQLFHRTKIMLEAIKSYSNSHKELNSVAAEAVAEHVSMFELAVVHLFIEHRVRSYLKSLPLKTMAKLFERDPVAMTDRDDSDLTPEKRQRIDSSLATEKHRGQTLSRWAKVEKKQETELRDFERKNKALLEAMVLDTYYSFRGAETPGSSEDKAFRKAFKRLRFGKGRKFDRLARLSMNATLTDYQIMNNTWVQSQDNLVAEFASIEVGFEVRHRGKEEVDVLAVERLTSIHTLIRTQRPEGLVYEAGASFRVTIRDRNGQSISRMLSVTNSPNQDFMEFAMTDSDSDFKQAVIKLNTSSHVFVEKMSEGLDFVDNKPVVLIAGGIGITPFRSLIQERFISDEKQYPVTLIYANRTEAPFESEFIALEEESDNFILHQIRSTHVEGWEGSVGRINNEYLEQVLGDSFNDSIFYIVGKPAMADATKEHLLSLGVSSAQVHIESFFENWKPEHFGQTQDQQHSTSFPPDAPIFNSEPGQFLCSCTSATAEEIQASIDRGHTTIETIREDLGREVGNVCGGCKSNVLNMLPGHAD